MFKLIKLAKRGKDKVLETEVSSWGMSRDFEKREMEVSIGLGDNFKMLMTSDQARDLARMLLKSADNVDNEN